MCGPVHNTIGHKNKQYDVYSNSMPIYKFHFAVKVLFELQTTITSYQLLLEQCVGQKVPNAYDTKVQLSISPSDSLQDQVTHYVVKLFEKPESCLPT